MKKILLTSLTLTLFLALALTSCTHENVRGGRVIRNAVIDIDGNHYDALKIGNQIWMQSNLRTTRFRDGSAIPNGNAIHKGTTVYSNTQPYYYQPTTQQVPMYDEKTYGLYYNWIAVNDARGLCPKGWHVPTYAEWTEMEGYVGSKSEYIYGDNPRNIAKALASNVGWRDCDEHGTPGADPEKNNATGFSAVPAGARISSSSVYEYYGHMAIFWSSTDNDSYGAMGCDIIYNVAHIFIGGAKDYKSGCSVRCVRDN